MEHSRAYLIIKDLKKLSEKTVQSFATIYLVHPTKVGDGNEYLENLEPP